MLLHPAVDFGGQGGTSLESPEPLEGTAAVVRLDVGPATHATRGTSLEDLARRHHARLLTGQRTSLAVLRSVPRAVDLTLDALALLPATRAAVHLGTIHERHGRVAGEPVEVTDRILASTPAGRIHVSAAVQGLLRASPRVTFVDRGPVDDTPGTWHVFEALAVLDSPRRPVPVVGRDRLLATVRDRVLSARLALLTAPAGAGKTTILEHLADEIPTAWCGMAARPLTAAALAREVVEGLRTHVPGVPSSLTALTAGLRRTDGVDLLARADAFATFCADAVAERLTGDLVLVIDGAERLVAVPGVAAIVESLARSMPPHVHLVVAGRARPELRMSRLDREGELAEIGPDLLRLTDDEVAELAAVAGIPDGPGQARVIACAGGLPEPARLAIACMRAGRTPDSAADAVRCVLDDLDDDHRLVVTSLVALGELPEPVLAHLVGRSIGPVIGDLQDAGLVRRTRAGSLEANAATARDVTVDPSRAHRWALTAAAFAEARGDVDLALRLLADADDRAALARTVRDHGAALLVDGHAETVLHVVERVFGRLDGRGSDPADLAEKDVRALAGLGGEAARLLSEPEAALSWMRRSTHGLTSIPDRLSWQMGMILHVQGEIDQARGVYALAADDGTDDDRALVRAWDAAGAWLQGDVDTCRDRVVEAMSLAESSGAPSARAAAHTVRAMLAAVDGDRQANDHHYLEALDHAEQAGDLLQVIRIHSNRGSRLLEEGDHLHALAELDVALRTAEVAGELPFRAMAASNRGQVLRRLGRLDEASADLHLARDLFSASRSRMVAYALAHLGEVLLVRGDIVLAEATLEEAVALSRPVGDMQGLVPALARLARVHIGTDLDLAARLAAEAAAETGSLGHGEAVSALALVGLHQGNLDVVRDAVDRGMRVARSRRDRPTMATLLAMAGEATAWEDPQKGLTLLRQSRDLWARLGCVLEEALVNARMARHTGGSLGAAMAAQAVTVLRDHGAQSWADSAEEILRSIERRHVAPVDLQLLGSEGVRLDGMAIQTGTWAEHERQVLRVLALHHPNPVALDRLAATCGTAEAAQAALDGLAVRLGPHASALVRGNAKVRLDPTVVDSDLVRFRDLAARGLAADGTARDTAMLRAAEATYRGALVGDGDAFATFRDELQKAYEQVLRALLPTMGPAARVSLLIRLLENDPQDERAHLDLVRSLDAVGRREEARRRYRAYAQVMHELGVEPAPFPTPALGLAQPG